MDLKEHMDAVDLIALLESEVNSYFADKASLVQMSKV
jgi:hypothetical protein